MKLIKRGGVAAIAIAGAAFVAAGCGGSGGGSGAAAAAKDSAALDFVPKDAIGYVTIDTDFDGDNWKQFNDLATAFDADFKGVEDQLVEAAEGAEAEEGDEKVDYKKDVEPWLGDSAGVAILDAGKGEEGEPGMMVWVELEDKAKFEDFAKDRKWEKGDDIGDWTTYSDPEDDSTHVAVSDELAVMAPTRKELEARVEYDGDSITDADGVGDAIDEAGEDALATLVLNGAGIRKAVKGEESLKSVANSSQLKDLKALAVSVAAEDEGMRVSGFVGSDGEDAGENVKHPIFEELPGDTVLALGGSDFGGNLEKVLEDLGKDNAQIQQGVGAAEGALGIEMEDVAKAFEGEFVLGMMADDEGLGSLAGGVAGAAMGGGLGGVDPSQLAQSASIVLAFEETGEASETLDKLVGAGAGLAGATAAPKTGEAGDFETKELSLAGFPVTTASSDDIAALQLGKDVLGTWGDETLADNDTFKSAWDAAEAPGDSAGVMWLDVARIGKLAGVKSGDKHELGGMVGWAEVDGSNGKFQAYLHLPEA